MLVMDHTRLYRKFIKQLLSDYIQHLELLSISNYPQTFYPLKFKWRLCCLLQCLSDTIILSADNGASSHGILKNLKSVMM